MLFMHPAAFPEPGDPPPADVVADMMRFNGELAQAGVLLALDGLTHPEDGACVRYAGGRPSVTDGPFTEATELVGGYWVIQASSKEEAVQWAARCPGAQWGSMEVRPVWNTAAMPEDRSSDVPVGAAAG